MGIQSKAGQTAIKIGNMVVDMIVLIATLLLVAIGSYALWDSKQVNTAASSDQYNKYKPTVENQGLTFEELKAINPDVFAWLTVYGTNIDYPVVQGEDNYTYVNTNAEGNYSLPGAIFLDYQASRDFSDFSSIVYGHHMEKKTMFGEIGNFVEREYFDARKYGMLYVDGVEYGIEFFAFVQADAYDQTVFRAKIESDVDRQEYIYRLYDLSAHIRDIIITPADRIILLATCSNFTTNGRELLVGKITDEVFADPFYVENPEYVRTIYTIDSPLAAFWPQSAVGLAVVLIVLLLFALALAVTIFIKNRRRWSYRHYFPQDYRPRAGPAKNTPTPAELINY